MHNIRNSQNIARSPFKPERSFSKKNNVTDYQQPLLPSLLSKEMSADKVL